VSEDETVGTAAELAGFPAESVVVTMNAGVDDVPEVTETPATASALPTS
jgi:hypothetical protein